MLASCSPLHCRTGTPNNVSLMYAVLSPYNGPVYRQNTLYATLYTRDTFVEGSRFGLQSLFVKYPSRKVNTPHLSVSGQILSERVLGSCLYIMSGSPFVGSGDQPSLEVLLSLVMFLHACQAPPTGGNHSWVCAHTSMSMDPVSVLFFHSLIFRH